MPSNTSSWEDLQKAFWQTPSPARTLLAVAIAALVAKLPQAVLSLAMPHGSDGVIPSSGNPANGWVALLWALSSLVLVAMRHWLGWLSSVCFMLLSLVSGFRLFSEGFVLWSTVQLVTSVIGIIALVLAIRAIRWPTKA
ncbi:MAG: hypothetical protein Q4B08_12275 [Propionibacteriaceae bacterium]|nr:hypothetical protein [Propionibacteriaceae bacterium]